MTLVFLYGKEKVCNPSGSSKRQQLHYPEVFLIARHHRSNLLE
jgi:hypothetical protein